MKPFVPVCLIALLVAGAVFAPPAWAEDESASLRDAIDDALAQNPDVRLRRAAPGTQLPGARFDVGGMRVILDAPPPPPPPYDLGPVQGLPRQGYAPAPQPNWTPVPAPVATPAPVAAPVAAPAPAAAPANENLPKTCGWFGPCCLRPDPWTCKDPCTPEPCEKPWSLEMTLGLNVADGNSDKFDITFGGIAKYEQYPWIIRWVWLWAYGETDGEATTDSFNTDIRFERRFGTKWSAFASLDYNTDEIAGLQHRYIGNVGVGYWVFERVGTYLKLEAGGGYTVEKRRFQEETESPSGYLGAEFLYEFRNNIDFKTRARYFPNFDDYDLSLFVWEASLAIPLCEGVSVALTARWDYVLDPPAPTESSDLLLTMGIQANF